MPPCTETWPTPVTSDSRGAIMRVGEIAQRAQVDSLSEVSASVMIGASAGFTFE